MTRRPEFCYNCGHDLMSHAAYSYYKGHMVYDFEPYTFKQNWLGLPMTIGIRVPKLVDICSCMRFVSKEEKQKEEEKILDG